MAYPSEAKAKIAQYGVCECCGEALEPVWFTEEEYKVVYGSLIHTGRTRRAVSHLTCPGCFRNYCVDDSFDDPWH